MIRNCSPAVLLFDTTVLIPALGKKIRKSDDPASGRLLEAMIQHRRSVLIAAPSLAELFRRAPQNPVPRTQWVRVVVFDGLAAELLGRSFPPEVLIKARDQSGALLHYLKSLKYDAMIVACAVRHRAAMLVTTDEG